MDNSKNIIRVLENQDLKEDLVILNNETLNNGNVQLPTVSRSFTFGSDYTEVGWGEGDAPPTVPPSPPRTEVKSPMSDIIPPSPVISSTSRRGSRKHHRIRSRRSADIVRPKPLFADEQRARSDPSSQASHRTDGEDSAETGGSVGADLRSVDTPPRQQRTPGRGSQPQHPSPNCDHEEFSIGHLPTDITEDSADSPCTRLAASLGCEAAAGSPAWVTSMETPSQARPRPGPGQLSTVERRELLPSAQGRKLSPKTLFDPSLAADMNPAQVLNIKRTELVEVDSDSTDDEGVENVQGCKPINLENDKETKTPLKSIENKIESSNAKVTTESKPKDIENDSEENNADEVSNGSHENVSPEMGDFIGFRTGGGKQINITEKALNEAKNRLNNLEHNAKPVDTNLQEKGDFIGFKTGGGKQIKISEGALSKAKLRMDNLIGDVRSKQNNLLDNNAVGFRTGSGKIVSVSESSLSEAKIKLDALHLPGGSASSVKETVSASALFAPGTNCGIDRSNEEKDSKGEDFKFSGFKTAGGSTIKISEEALNAAKEKISGPEAKIEQMPFSGFKTAGGTSIKISDEALETAKKKFAGDMMSFADKDCKMTPTGFKTAGGTNIKISEEAINIARKKLNQKADNQITASVDGDPGQERISKSEHLCAGFQTAGGSKIKISDDALKAAKIKLQDNSINLTGKVVGFQTAKGGIINISKDALEKAKMKMEDRDLKYPMSKFGDASNGMSSNIKSPDQIGDDFDSEDDKLLLEFCSNPNQETPRQPYTCKPFDVNFRRSPYRCGPNFDENNVGEAEGYQAPFADVGNSDESEFNFELVVGKKRKYSECEFIEEGNSSILLKREVARKKQKSLIDAKSKKQIRPIAGRLWNIKSNGGNELTLRDLELDMGGSVARPGCVTIDWDTADSFVFEGRKYFSEENVANNVSGMSLGDGVLAILTDEGDLGVEQLEAALLAAPGVDPRLVPAGWVRHHYRWLVWSLACYQRSLRGGQALLSPRNLAAKLKYRYDRELAGGERSVVRRVLEGDESPGVAMVLCVAAVSGAGDRLTLSDGWYHLQAPLYPGSVLHRLVTTARITVGCKLITQGAEITGSQAKTPCHPLEEGALEGRDLRLHPNSTRRAAWWLRLGRWTRGPMVVRLGSCREGGGTVSALRLVVARVYPLVYWARPGPGQPAAWWPQRDWDRRQREAGPDSMEDLYRKVEKELLQAETAPVPQRLKESDLRDVDCGEELYQLLRDNDDPSLYRCLSEFQLRLLEETRRSKAEELRRRIKEEVEARLKKTRCDSCPVLKLRVVDAASWAAGGHSAGEVSGLVTVWRPGDSWTEVREGHHVVLGAVSLSRAAGATLHLTATKQTTCSLVTAQLLPSRRALTALASLSGGEARPLFGEVDCVVAVVSAQQLPGRTLASVTDPSLGPLVRAAQLVVWAGESGRAAASLLQPGAVLSCSNLEWRPQSGGALHYTTTSIITTNPRDKDHQTAMEHLQSLMNTDKMCLAKTPERLLTPTAVTTPQPSPAPRRPSAEVGTTPATVRSSWTPGAGAGRKCAARLELLDRDIALQQQRLYLEDGRSSSVSPAPVPAPAPPPSPALVTPFKPPKSSLKGGDGGVAVKDVSSEEWESAEFMDQMEVENL